MSRMNLLIDLLNAKQIQAIGMPQWAGTLKAWRAGER